MRALFLRFFTWLTGINLTELNARPIPLPDLEDQLEEVNNQLRTMGDWENYCPEDFDSRISEIEDLDHSAKFDEITTGAEEQQQAVADMLEKVHNQAVTISSVDQQIEEHLHYYCTEEELETMAGLIHQRTAELQAQVSTIDDNFSALDSRVTDLDNYQSDLVQKLYDASQALSRAANLMALGSG